jgi:hypothetical protein
MLDQRGIYAGFHWEHALFDQEILEIRGADTEWCKDWSDSDTF